MFYPVDSLSELTMGAFNFLKISIKLNKSIYYAQTNNIYYYIKNKYYKIYKKNLYMW